jgi:hypothetical protein
MPQVDAAASDDPSSGDRTVAVVIEPPARHHTDTDPGFRLPMPTQAPKWLPYVGALVILLLLLAALRACDGGDDPAGPSGTTASSEESPSATAPDTVDVATEDYLGRPVAEARSELEDLGLVVTVGRSDGGGPVGTVKEVSPTGELDVGSQVTLDVVAEPEPPEEKKPDKGKDKSPGPNDKEKGP